MAIAQKQTDRLFKLLVAAAGQDAAKVRSITCRVGIREPVSFDVELIGKEDDIERALPAVGTPLDEARFTVRTLNILESAGITSMEDLLAMKSEDFTRLRTMKSAGERILVEVANFIEARTGRKVSLPLTASA